MTPNDLYGLGFQIKMNHMKHFFVVQNKLGSIEKLIV